MNAEPSHNGQVSRKVQELHELVNKVQDQSIALEERLSGVMRHDERPETEKDPQKEEVLVDLADSINSAVRVLQNVSQRNSRIQEFLEL